MGAKIETMTYLLFFIWLFLGAILSILSQANFNKLENYVKKQYADEYKRDLPFDGIFSRTGRSPRGHVKHKILLGRYNPHPEDRKFNEFILIERLLAISFLIWILSLFLLYFLIK